MLTQIRFSPKKHKTSLILKNAKIKKLRTKLTIFCNFWSKFKKNYLVLKNLDCKKLPTSINLTFSDK